MGIFFRKTKRVGKNTNVTISKRGATVSRKAGPVRISSKGNVSLRLGKGVGIRKKLW